MSATVLICDQSGFARSMIREILSERQYEIVGEADSGTRAIELFRALRPKLVTIDLVIPGLSGIDVIQEIMQDEPDARVVVCSAMGQHQLIAESMKAGAREFVAKPFQPSRILEAARRALS